MICLRSQSQEEAHGDSRQPFLPHPLPGAPSESGDRDWLLVLKPHAPPHMAENSHKSMEGELCQTIPILDVPKTPRSFRGSRKHFCGLGTGILGSRRLDFWPHSLLRSPGQASHSPTSNRNMGRKENFTVPVALKFCSFQ